MIIAQAFVFAIYAATATDPNTTAPISVQTYQAECGLFPKWIEQAPLVNPVEGYTDDPDDEKLDCRMLVAAQIRALPPFTTYRAAVKLQNEDEFGPLSTVFQVVSEEPPPPPTRCFDGATPYAVFTNKTWQWRPSEVVAQKARLEAAGWVFQTWPTKTNKQWQWWTARCEG